MENTETRKHALQELLETVRRAGDVDIHVRSYSGRGMYGKECLGVTVRSGDLGELFASVLDVMHHEDSSCDTIDQICKAWRRMSQDNMGRDMIYYFPSIPYVKGDPDVDDEEENE